LRFVLTPTPGTTSATFAGDTNTTLASRPLLSLTATAVPEPSGMGFLAVALPMLLRRRK
jgi:hypothetical protein